MHDPKERTESRYVLRVPQHIKVVYQMGELNPNYP